MILREGAVLLIIGAVVIGPIQWQITDGGAWLKARDAECAEAEYPNICADLVLNEDSWRKRITAETCTRAMKEIGAKNFNAGNGQPDTGNVWTYPDGTTAFYDQPMHRIGKAYGPGHIVCIPAPTGMK